MSPSSLRIAAPRALAMLLFATASLRSQTAPPATDAPPPCHGTPRAKVAALPMDRKSVLLREAAERLRKSNAPFIGEAALTELPRKLAELPPNAPPGRIVPLRMALGDAFLATGAIDAAIGEFDACLALTTSTDNRARIAIWKKLAIAWMRAGERRNCVARHNQDSCILPLREDAIHVDREGSTKAIQYLTHVLNNDGNDLSAIWLLNVAAMTLGRWPDGVPAQWRIPAHAFDSERELPRMLDVAAAKGIAPFERGGGAIMDDFDADGRLDLLVSSIDPEEPLRLFHHEADGTFRDIAPEAGLSGQLGGLQVIHFDADNDGRLDLLVQRGAWLHESGEIPNSLLMQQADGTFVDRTLEAGIEIAAPSQVACVADIDRDGDLDLFLGYENATGERRVAYPCRMFRNKGDGTFEDITELAGVQNGRFCKGAAFGDYDGDGLPDLYVANLNGPNRLYHNDGGGRFHDVALELGVADPFDAFACWFFDFDNDGRLDLYVTCYNQTARAAEMASYYKNGSTGSDTQRLYQNDGHGGFRDVTTAKGLRRVVFPMGCNFGDVDNDGWPDLYLATGDPDFTSLFPNILYRNDGGRRFEDVTTATGTGHLQKGHGTCFGDLDGDGDQDLYVQTGGAYKDDAFASVLFENPGHGNHWLTVDLVGHASNRFGIGARIKVTIDEPTGPRDVYAFVGANSSFGGNPLRQTIGLGAATRIVKLVVDWPHDGPPQELTGVPLDRTIVIEEGGGFREGTRR